MFRGRSDGAPAPCRPVRGLPARAAAGSRRTGRLGGGAPIQAVLLVCLLFVALLAGCNRVGPGFQKMAIQPKYDPLEPSDLFADGMAARPRIAGTVARTDVIDNGFFETGKIGGVVADGFPFPITAADINRGEERFTIYCSECHGRLADGNGMIPSRGFRRPPSFHTDVLRTARTGHFIDVMTNGFGAMPPYAAQVPERDRWLIVAYIRALQLSQNAAVADVPADKRVALSTGGAR